MAGAPVGKPGVSSVGHNGSARWKRLFMAINPPTDIIFEVAKAADPNKVAAAEQRLRSLAGARASSAGGAFAVHLEQAAAATRSAGSSASGPGARAHHVEEDFEAVLLNSFVGEMLPKSSESVFGGGMAGDMWRSMLSDQVSRQIAKSGQLGIARRLFASHPLPETLASLDRPHVDVPLSSPNEAGRARTDKPRG